MRVGALDARDRARLCGVRVGDVITHINGIHVGDDHAAAVRLIDRATACRAPLVRGPAAAAAAVAAVARPPRAAPPPVPVPRWVV